MPKPSTVADIFEQLRTHGTVPWQDEDKPAEEDKDMKYTNADVDMLLDALEAKQSPQQAKLQPYTVLMITPDYLSNAYGHDSYCAWVEAENVEQAQLRGQEDAVRELTDPDDTDPSRPEDFFIVFVCEGHMADIHIW